MSFTDLIQTFIRRCQVLLSNQRRDYVTGNPEKGDSQAVWSLWQGTWPAIDYVTEANSLRSSFSPWGQLRFGRSRGRQIRYISQGEAELLVEKPPQASSSVRPKAEPSAGAVAGRRARRPSERQEGPEGPTTSAAVRWGAVAGRSRTLPLSAAMPATGDDGEKRTSTAETGGVR